MRSLLFPLALLVSASAVAQVNKCTVDGKVTYTSEPCAAGKAQAVDNSSQVCPSSAPGTPPPTRNAYAAELNNRIAEALRRDDFATARRLAVTDEHFRVIAEVEQIVAEERQAAKAERACTAPYGMQHFRPVPRWV